MTSHRSPATASPGRAGRNLPVATAVGLVLAALVLGTLYTQRWLFLVLEVLAILVALYELTGALRRSAGFRPPVEVIAVGVVVMLVGAYTGGVDAFVVAFALTVLGVVAWPLAANRDGYLRDVTSGIFVTVYLPLLAGFAALMLAAPDGADRIFVFILVTVMSDIGGYAAGVLFGRHRMAPVVSPKKSWEGFGGSLAACMVAGGVSVPLLLGAAWWQGVALGALVCLSATLGDLGESLVKRDLAIKDMGTLLPGHGGLMDRLDSLLPTAPVAAVAFVVMLGSGFAGRPG